jgi:uncharacterized MAPEG superfamily protein
MSSQDQDGDAMTEEAREFAMRLQGFAQKALSVMEPAEVVNSFAAIAIGAALTHMPRESAAGWLRAMADHIESSPEVSLPRIQRK